jgi:ankyrin repeat protein
MWASGFGHAEVVKLLLDQGAGVNMLNEVSADSCETKDENNMTHLLSVVVD